MLSPERRTHVVIPGLIRPWKRAQYNKKLGVTYTDAEWEAYAASMRDFARRAMETRPPTRAALELSLVAVFPIPNSWSPRKRQQAEAGLIPKTSRPDLDNVIKGLKDALQLIVFHDDAQIVQYGRCAKIFGTHPRLEALFTPVEYFVRALPLDAPVTPVTAQIDLFAHA